MKLTKNITSVFDDDSSKLFKIALQYDDMDFVKTIFDPQNKTQIQFITVENGEDQCIGSVAYHLEYDLHGPVLSIIKSQANDEATSIQLWDSVVKKANQFRVPKIINQDVSDNAFNQYCQSQIDGAVQNQFTIALLDKKTQKQGTSLVSIAQLSEGDFESVRDILQQSQQSIEADIPFIINGLRSSLKADNADVRIVSCKGTPQLLMVASSVLDNSNQEIKNVHAVELTKLSTPMVAYQNGLSSFAQDSGNVRLYLSNSCEFQRQLMLTASVFSQWEVSRENYADIEVELAKLPNVKLVSIPKATNV